MVSPVRRHVLSRALGLSTLPARRFVSLKTYALVGESRGAAACSVRTDTGHTIDTDLPRKLGGRDEAAQPVELLLAALLGCKTATAHYVARHLWQRPNNRIDGIEWVDVVAIRDDDGATSLPITQAPNVSARLMKVSGVGYVRPRGPTIMYEDVKMLGELVEQRCPVAVTLAASGCEVDFEWRLAPR